MNGADTELAKWLARELDLEDWKRIYAGLMFGIYDGRTGKVRNLDGSKGLSDYDIRQYFYLPSKAASIVTYVGKTIGYLIEGRFANDGTVLAAAVDIGLAFFGLDLYSDLRDTAYLATHWENNKECYLEAGLIALQYLPVIGSFTKRTKAYAVVQNSRLTCSVMETTTKVLTQVKNSGVVRYGSNLVFTAKQAVKELGSETCYYIQQAMLRVKNSVSNLDTRLNSNMMEAFSNLSADTKKLLNDNHGMIDLDAVIETAAKECKTAEHSSDDVVEILEREIKGGLNFSNIREQMMNSSSAELWGVLDDGTNQGVKHFADYWEKYPERIPSLAERLGVDVSQFENSVDGFKNFTEQALNVKNNGILREVNGKQIYYMEGAANPNKGVVVIFKDGKIQSMMPSKLKDFNNLQ